MPVIHISNVPGKMANSKILTSVINTTNAATDTLRNFCVLTGLFLILQLKATTNVTSPSTLTVEIAKSFVRIKFNHSYWALFSRICFLFISETPKPVGVCVRQNGFFPHPDPSICNIFYNCVNGHELEVTCAPGLHFNSKTATCVWPETAGRSGCRSDANSKWIFSRQSSQNLNNLFNPQNN